MSNKCLVIFIKYPEEGSVKSRLAKSIGNKRAKDLYICFVEDILNKFIRKGFDIKIFYSPIEKEENIKDWLGESFHYIPQVGNDLGEKMQNTFIKLLDIYENVMIIGSDSPDLPIDFINKGFNYLEKIGTVIGKSKDGGYYLIGFNKNFFLSEIFHNIQWSTDSVLKDTIKILKENEHGFYILDEWYDIDNIEDLKYLYSNNLNSEFKNSKTMLYIRENISF